MALQCDIYGSTLFTCTAWLLQAEAKSNGSSNGDHANYDFDLFTIGAGSGGVRGSRFAAQNYGKHFWHSQLTLLGPMTKLLRTDYCGKTSPAVHAPVA